MNRVLERGDLDAAMKAWCWLRSKRLASRLVCRSVFASWSLCACGRCRDDDLDGEP